MKFVQGVGAKNMVIQLGTALNIQREAPYFTHHVALTGLIPAGTEFNNRVVGGQLIFEVAQVVAVRWMKWWIDGAQDVDDRDCVEIEYAFLEVMECFREVETGVTGGEGSDEDVEVDRG